MEVGRQIFDCRNSSILPVALYRSVLEESVLSALLLYFKITIDKISPQFVTVLVGQHCRQLCLLFLSKQLKLLFMVFRVH